MNPRALAALAAFWTPALVLSGWLAWRVLRRPARQWEGLWLDSNEPGHHRTCSGAKSVTGPVVYRMYDETGQVAYVGQARNFYRRAHQHAESIKSMAWVRWDATSCRARDLDDIERAGISRYRPRQNRTRGNT